MSSFNLSFSVESSKSGIINNSTKYIGCERDKVTLPNPYDIIRVNPKYRKYPKSLLHNVRIMND